MGGLGGLDIGGQNGYGNTGSGALNMNVNLGTGNGGNNGENGGMSGLQVQMPNLHLTSSFRRRMEEENEEVEMFGRKCRMFMGGEICADDESVRVRTYERSAERDIAGDERIRRFEPINVGMNVSGDVRMHEMLEENEDDDVRYISERSFTFVPTLEGESEQCLEYAQGFTLCLEVSDGGEGVRAIVNGDTLRAFRFWRDADWNEIEIEREMDDDEEEVTRKCGWMFSGEVASKLCVERCEDVRLGVAMYKASVQSGGVVQAAK